MDNKSIGSQDELLRTHIAVAEALYEALSKLMAATVRRGPREISLTAASTLLTVEQTGPRRITELTTIEGVAQPSMTALVTGLERAGLVERRQEPGDRRVVLVALSSAGADYLKSRRRGGAEAFVQLIDKLPSDEVAALVAATPALQHLFKLITEQRAAAGSVHQGVSQGESNA